MAPDPSLTVPFRTIWYVWPYLEWGGAQIYFLGLAEAARRRGFTVRALMPTESSIEIRRMYSGNDITVDTFDGRLDSDAAPTVARRVERRLRNRAVASAMVSRLDELHCGGRTGAIVHVDVAPWSAAGFWSALLARYPAVVTLHTGLPAVGRIRTWAWRRRFSRLFEHRHFRLLASNHDVKRSLLRYVEPERVDGIGVSYSSINAAEIERTLVGLPARVAAESRLRLPPALFRIGVVGRMIERKGVLVLARALALLVARGVSVQAVWFAPEPPGADVRQALAGTGGADLLQHRTSQDLGGDPRAALAAVRSTTDLFVLPSLLEGLPTALVEAMALGMACLTTRVNAIPEAIRHGENGWLVEPGDPEALADAIGLLAADPPLRQRLGKAARADALTRFEIDHVARPTLEVYADPTMVHR